MSLFTNLTAPQEEILTLLAQGLSNKEIAHQLTICVPTVQNHVAALLAALAVKNRTEAATVYWQRLSQISNQVKNS